MQESETANFTELDDPTFLAERARLRGQLAHQSESTPGRAERKRRYTAMTEEFLRRARIAWTTGS